MELAAILETAKAAAAVEAQRIWVRDEMQDCGSCGGAMLMLDGRSKLAKTAIEMNIAIKSGKDIFVRYLVPDNIKSQNADIPQGAFRAFRKVLIEAGQEKAIKKFWTYTD